MIICLTNLYIVLLLHNFKTTPNIETLDSKPSTTDLNEILNVSAAETPTNEPRQSVDSIATVKSPVAPPVKTKAVIKIAAIDNGLAFPCKHPDEWRACTSFFFLMSENLVFNTGYKISYKKVLVI